MSRPEEDEKQDAGVVTAAALVIGDEILSGRTKDKNIGAIADHLAAIGIVLSEVRIVPDQEEAIVAAVNELRARYTYVFTTGGIGPTHDDITADSIARASGVPIDVDERAVAILKDYYAPRGIELTPTRLRMARIPHGAALVRNSVSSAPGFMLGNVIVMAGIPAVMEAMLVEATAELRCGRRMHSLTIDVSRPEGEIAELFAAHQQEFADVAMGSYPFYSTAGRFNTQLVLRSTDAERLVEAHETLKAKLVARGLL